MKEIRLSKSQAAHWPKDRMQRFLRILEAWVLWQNFRGYAVESNPDEGPGTMRWTARRRPS